MLRCCSLNDEAQEEMQKHGKAAGPAEFVLLTLLGVLTGVPYPPRKIALATIPPVTMVAARVSPAAIVLRSLSSR